MPMCIEEFPEVQDAWPIIDLGAIGAYLTHVVVNYEGSAPTVSAWANALYTTLGKDVLKVTALELLVAQALYDGDGWRQWEPPHLAAKRIDKLLDALGKDTPGQPDF